MKNRSSYLPGRARPALAILLLLAIGSATAAAGQPVVAPTPAAPTSSFSISPLRIEITQNAESTLFQVRNQSNGEMALQARTFVWSQPEGSDRYEPSNDFAISPAISRIKPGQVQNFRVVRLVKLPEGKEAAYRVVLDQLPSPQDNPDSGAFTRLRLTVPLFTGSDKASAAKLDWSAGSGSVVATNQGGRTAKVHQVSLILADGRSIQLGNGASRYILPHSSIAWSIPQSVGCIKPGASLAATIDKKLFNAPATPTCA